MQVDDLINTLRGLRNVHGGLPVEFVGKSLGEPTKITDVIAVDDLGDDVADREDIAPVALQIS